MKTFKVLVVDDNKQVREILADQLEDIGVSAHFATDGQHALDYLKSCSGDDLPNLIISDFVMNKGDGGNLLNSVRSEPSWSAIKFWMLSGADPKTVTSTAGKFKPDGFIEKPWNFKELEKKLKALIEIFQKKSA